MFRDGHHVLHSKLEWSLRPEARALRETPSLIPRLDRRVHDEIHQECPPVPLLGHYALARTVRTFEPTGHTMTDIDRLMKAIETSSDHPKAHDLERDLALLAVQAIDLQRPFIAAEIGRRAA